MEFNQHPITIFRVVRELWKFFNPPNKSEGKVFAHLRNKNEYAKNVAFPEGLDKSDTQKIEKYIEFCVSRGEFYILQTDMLEYEKLKWIKMKEKPMIRQIASDVNPIDWIIYLFNTKIRKQKEVSPLIRPFIYLEKIRDLQNLLYKRLGKHFFFLDQLNNLFLSTEVSSASIQLFLRSKLIEFLIFNQNILPFDHSALSSTHLDSFLDPSSDLSVEQFLQEKYGEADLDELIELVTTQSKELENLIKKGVEAVECKKSRWITYSMMGIVVIGVSIYIRSKGIEVILRSVDNTITQWTDAVSRFFQNHIEEPLTKIYRTIRYDEASLGINASVENLESERQALATMVTNYISSAHPSTSAEILAEINMKALDGDVSMIISDYAESIRSPLREALFGPLLQLVLIQVHKLKVDAEKTVVVMDKLMRANELNFQILTLLPAVALFSVLVPWLFKLIRRKPSSRTLSLEFRKALRDVSIILNNKNRYSESALNKKDSQGHDNSLTLEEYGKLAYSVNILQGLAYCLPLEERHLFLADAQKLLESSFTLHQKVAIVNRIYQNHVNHL